MVKAISEKPEPAVRVDVDEVESDDKPSMLVQDDPDTRQLALTIATVARDNKAMDVVALRVAGRSSFADWLVVCSGRSDRQVQAIAERIQSDIHEQLGLKPRGVEGETRGQWVLIDYGLVVAHVFYEPLRGFYDLEGLWSDVERIEIADAPPPVMART
jgi:ribosome-associated protein